jgi:hypothetical protein
MPHKTNNPAGRLLEIVDRGKSYNGGLPVIDVWSNILSTPASDYSLLIRRIGHVMALPSQIKSAMEGLEEYNPNIYLKWLPNVENAFKAVHFQMQWNQFISNFDGTGILGRRAVMVYTYELAWNSIKDLFEAQGAVGIIGSRDAFCLAFKRGQIDNANLRDHIERVGTVFYQPKPTA